MGLVKLGEQLGQPLVLERPPYCFRCKPRDTASANAPPEFPREGSGNTDGELLDTAAHAQILLE